MADPYFHFVTAQFRATRQNVLDLNSAIPYGYYARPNANAVGNSPTITNEYTFLNPFSFKFVKPQVICLEKNIEGGTIPCDPARFFSSNFTIEGRFYLTSMSAAICLLECWSSSNGWKLVVNTNGTIQFQERSIAITLISTTGTAVVQLNTPFHVAVTRSGTTCRIFLNGVNIIEVTLSTAHSWTTSAPSNLNIGGQWNTRAATNDMDGYADDIRITRGIARYTANFTPPVADDFSEYYLPVNGNSKYYEVPNRVEYFSISREKALSGFSFPDYEYKTFEGFYNFNNNYGDGEIIDTVTVDDVPSIRRITLLERFSKTMLRHQFSTTDGIFHIKGLDKSLPYMLLAEDDITSVPRKNAVIRDFVRCIPKIVITKKPTNFTSGQTSQMFEIRAINYDVPVTVTLSTTDDLTFSSNTITILPNNKTGYFTVTPATTGNKTISFTNSVNSNNPANFTFTAA